MTRINLTLFSAMVAFGLAAAGQSAFAEAPDLVSVKVAYTDLNTSTDGGAKVLLQRIRAAAASVCGEPDGSMASRAEARQCRKEIVERTVASMHNERLTAANGGRAPVQPVHVASAR